MSGAWATGPTSCRDAADAGWASDSRSCRDGLLYVEEGYVEEGYIEVQFAAWATAPPACRDAATFTGLDAGLGIDLDCLYDSGTVVTEHGWSVPSLESCRDG